MRSSSFWLLLALLTLALEPARDDTLELALEPARDDTLELALEGGREDCLIPVRLVLEVETLGASGCPREAALLRADTPVVSCLPRSEAVLLSADMPGTLVTSCLPCSEAALLRADTLVVSCFPCSDAALLRADMPAERTRSCKQHKNQV